MNSNREPIPTKPEAISSVWVLGARITWVIFGPMVLLLITYGIVSGGTGWLTPLDAAFAVVACLMLLGRWTEHRSGAATTLSEEPATDEQLRRYVAVLIPVLAAVWIIANLVGNHVLS